MQALGAVFTPAVKLCILFQVARATPEPERLGVNKYVCPVPRDEDYETSRPMTMKFMIRQKPQR